jgi:hypothetical protein
MSSYICSPKHFNSIAESLKVLISKSNFYLPYELKEKFENIVNKKNDWQNEIDLIVDELRKINVLAVTLQYKHHYEGVLDAEIAKENLQVFEKTPIFKLSPINLFKQLQCLDYQIEVEHITDIRNLTELEENAMLFLNEIINVIACYICKNSNEYDECGWGID